LLFKAAWPIFAARTNSSESTEGAVAQSVEQRTENPCVAGSIPAHTTNPNRNVGVFLCPFNPKFENPQEFNSKYMKSIIIILGTCLLFACTKTESPAPTPSSPTVVLEEPIKFTTNFDTGSTNILDTVSLNISISSKIPAGGLNIGIEIIRQDSNIKIFKLDSNLNQATLTLKINGLKFPTTYLTNIIITSKTTSANNSSKTILLTKNQYLEEYSKINQTTGWYNTNKLFGGRNFFIDSNTTYSSLWTKDNILGYTYSSSGPTYFSNRQGLFYGDLNGDGKKDIFNNYWPTPFGANMNGYYATFEYEKYWFSKPNLLKGLTGARKFIINDYYGNGKKSMLICSSGADAPPFPGDSVQIISFGSDLTMTAKNLTEVLGYFHGGASGDIDNDGDIDILLYSGGGSKPMGPVYYENIGSGNFKYNANLITGLGYVNNNPNNYYTTELFDLNNDGFLDIIFASGNGDVVSRILWGSASHTFNTSNQTILPDASYTKSSIVDVAFSDIDKDGDIDLLLNYAIGYSGFGIQILENQNNKFIDVTSKRVDVASKPLSVWYGWLRLYDVDFDGDLDIVADGIAYIQNQQFPNAQPVPNISWINDGKGNYKSFFYY